MSERREVEIDESGYMHWKGGGASFRSGTYREVLPGDINLDEVLKQIESDRQKHAALVEAARALLNRLPTTEDDPEWPEWKAVYECVEGGSDE